ncbi:UPF0481 protein, partial [Mucuna pruriens]
MTETLDLDQKFTQLEKAKQIPQKSVPKIQKVAHYLRDRKHFIKHYVPKLVSMGPIHHGKMALNLGEQYKLMWAAQYLERTNQDAKTLYRKIASNIQQLKQLFAENVIEDFLDDEKLSWMLLVDGCSLLQLLGKGNLNNPDQMHVKVDQLVAVWLDVILLENQLPYQLLKLLSGHENDDKLLKRLNEFLLFYGLSPVRLDYLDSAWDEERNTGNEDELQGEHRVKIAQESPIHLLDLLHRSILGNPQKNRRDHKRNAEKTRRKQRIKEEFFVYHHRNIRAMKETGITLKASNSRWFTDISFSAGWFVAELKLPQIIVDETTATTFLNLIAYEMCADFKNNYEICSFVAFLASLIDHPDDAKELISAGVFVNALGSDEEVANLIKTISIDLVDMERYSHVRVQIEKHYRSKSKNFWGKWKTWIVLAHHKYFSNPWAAIALGAAIFALVLTSIQTWFTVHPPNQRTRNEDRALESPNGEAS